MALWGNLDAANNAPKQTDTTGYGGSTPQVTANGAVYFGNTKQMHSLQMHKSVFTVLTPLKKVSLLVMPSPHNMLVGICVKQV